jgi:hypothetical protein
MSRGFDPSARIRVLHVDDDPSHQTMLRARNVRAFPIPGNHLAVTFDDITDRVRYEERLLALHRHATGLDDLSSEEEVRE